MIEPNQNQETRLDPDERSPFPPLAGAAEGNGQSFSRQFERFVKGFEMAMIKIENASRELKGEIQGVKGEIKGVQGEIRGLQGEINGFNFSVFFGDFAKMVKTASV
ncbi:MAG: hypothetical protein LBO66_08880 [Deltaproteobacteria bacterium]|jgi:hypothetical protein|nr:hypothetical protein [Deltaproteobacteria bacterium]